MRIREVIKTMVSSTNNHTWVFESIHYQRCKNCGMLKDMGYYY